MDVPALIRQARYAAGLSQRILAERAGVSRHTLSHYEHGRRTPTLPSLTKILAAAGVQIRAELEPLDQDVRAAITAIAAQPTTDRDAVSTWIWLPDLAELAYRAEGATAANVLGAPIPVQTLDLTLADTPETFDGLADLMHEHAYMIRTSQRSLYRRLPRPYGDPATAGRRVREIMIAECPHGEFWMRCGFAELRVRLAPPADVARHVEVSTPHGVIRVAPLHEIETADPQATRVLRVMREMAGRLRSPQVE